MAEESMPPEVLAALSDPSVATAMAELESLEEEAHMAVGIFWGNQNDPCYCIIAKLLDQLREAKLQLAVISSL